MNTFKFTVLGAIDLLTVSAENSDHVKLAWKALPARIAKGYMVKWGVVSGSYLFSRDVGNRTEAIFTDLDSGKTYYFRVGYYFTQQKTPLAYSEEIAYKVP